jgi:hypothetical protein
MCALCLAYMINNPVVRAHHRQHKTSPTTLLKSTSLRGINAAINENQEPSTPTIEDGDSTNDQKLTPEATLRSQRHSQRKSHRATEPTSHHRRHGQTEPTNDDTDDLHQWMGHRANHNKPPTKPHVRKRDDVATKARPQKAWDERGQEKRPEAADPRVPTRA